MIRALFALLFLGLSFSVMSQKIRIGFVEARSMVNEPATGEVEHLIKVNVSPLPKQGKISLTVSRNDLESTAPIGIWNIHNQKAGVTFDSNSDSIQYVVIKIKNAKGTKDSVTAVITLESIDAPGDAPGDADFKIRQHTITIVDERHVKTQIEKKLDIALSHINERDTMGRLIFIGQTPSTYTISDAWPFQRRKNNPTNSNATLTHVHVNIKDGMILDLQAFTKDMVYTNVHPIALKELNERCDPLYGNKTVTKYNKSQKEIVRTCDVLMFERIQTFIPEDNQFNLSSSNTQQYLYNGTGVNQAFDFRIFTDVAGLFGDKPNGITQMELFGKIPMNNRIKNGWPFKGSILFNYFKTNLSFSKFDSKFSPIKLNADSSQQQIPRQQMLQTSWINFDFGINLIGTWLARKTSNWFYLDVGGGFNVSQVLLEGDSTTSIARKDTTVSVSMPYAYVEPVILLKAAQNMGIVFLPRIFWQWAKQDVFAEKFNDDVHFTLRPQITMYWNPKGLKSSRIFLRTSYYHDFQERAHPFYQFQVGYSVQLDELISGKTRSY